MYPDSATAMVKKLLWYCLFPLITGTLIYLFFHPGNLWLHKFVSGITGPLPNFFYLVRDRPVLHFLLYHLPDACWDFALAWFLQEYIIRTKFRFLQAAIIILILSFTETVQLFYPQQFTFDLWDLLIACLIAALVTLITTDEK